MSSPLTNIERIVLIAPTSLLILTFYVHYRMAIDTLILSTDMTDTGSYSNLKRLFRRSYSQEVSYDSIILGIVNGLLIMTQIDQLLGIITILGIVIPLLVLMLDDSRHRPVRLNFLALTFGWIGFQAGIYLTQRLPPGNPISGSLGIVVLALITIGVWSVSRVALMHAWR